MTEITKAVEALKPIFARSPFSDILFGEAADDAQMTFTVRMDVLRAAQSAYAALTALQEHPARDYGKMMQPPADATHCGGYPVDPPALIAMVREKDTRADAWKDQALEWEARATAAEAALDKIVRGRYDGLEVTHYSAVECRNIARAALGRQS
jgi:hypothetical protein